MAIWIPPTLKRSMPRFGCISVPKCSLSGPKAKVEGQNLVGSKKCGEAGGTPAPNRPAKLVDDGLHAGAAAEKVQTPLTGSTEQNGHHRAKNATRGHLNLAERQADPRRNGDHCEIHGKARHIGVMR